MSPVDGLRAAYRRLLPATARDRVRWLLVNLRPALASAPADLVGLLRAGPPVPGPLLRSRVARDCSRAEFLAVGRRLADSVAAALHAAGVHQLAGLRWLDFGCGSGRVARHLLTAFEPAAYLGLDIDRPAIRWCQRHLAGTFAVAPKLPPTELAASSVDVAFAISVFSHFDQPAQRRWLDEMVRVLVPGGHLVASTHGPDLTFELPHLTPPQHRRLADDGFLFVPGAGRFNADIAFHSLPYLDREWGPRLHRVHFEPHGMAGYQDVSVWRRHAEAGAPGVNKNTSYS